VELNHIPGASQCAHLCTHVAQPAQAEIMMFDINTYWDNNGSKRLTQTRQCSTVGGNVRTADVTEDWYHSGLETPVGLS
jgi:hypothetical protein